MSSEWIPTGGDQGPSPDDRTATSPFGVEADGAIAAAVPTAAPADERADDHALLADVEAETHRSAVDAADAVLDEVESALARLDDGTYGRCELCGEPIEDAKLAEMPVSRTCYDCDLEGTPGAEPSGLVTTSGAGSLDG